MDPVMGVMKDGTRSLDYTSTQGCLEVSQTSTGVAVAFAGPSALNPIASL